MSLRTIVRLHDDYKQVRDPRDGALVPRLYRSLGGRYWILDRSRRWDFDPGCCTFEAAFATLVAVELDPPRGEVLSAKSWEDLIRLAQSPVAVALGPKRKRPSAAARRLMTRATEKLLLAHFPSDPDALERGHVEALEGAIDSYWVTPMPRSRARKGYRKLLRWAAEMRRLPVDYSDIIGSPTVPPPPPKLVHLPELRAERGSMTELQWLTALLAWRYGLKSGELLGLHPSFFGRAAIESGEIFFEGRPVIKLDDLGKRIVTRFLALRSLFHPTDHVQALFGARRRWCDSLRKTRVYYWLAQFSLGERTLDDVSAEANLAHQTLDNMLSSIDRKPPVERCHDDITEADLGS